MGKVVDTFIVDTVREVKFHETVPALKLQGRIFRHYGEPPADMCDGGDYMKEVQIRIDNKKGDVYISVEPIERGEWWHGEISWEEFFGMMMKMVVNNDKFTHNKLDQI